MSFFLLSIIPVIGIVSVGHQAYADRYTYVPTSLFYLAICNSLVTFLARPMLSKPVKYSVSVVLIGLYCTLGFISAAQVKDWKNDESLWSAVIRKYPEQIFLAHQNLGNAYLSQRRYSEAITQYQIALQLNDNSAKTHENLGRAYGNTGEKDKEIEQYLLAIKKDNNSIWPRLFAGYFYLANRNVLLASEQFTQALRLDPLSAPAIIANTKIDILQQQYDTAKKRLSELLEHTPNQTEAIWMLAQLYYREGNTHDTQILLKKILSLAPDNKPAKDLLAKINQLNN
jgi:tetratricopeptide (TPR) repeat protein